MPEFTFWMNSPFKRGGVKLSNTFCSTVTLLVSDVFAFSGYTMTDSIAFDMIERNDHF